MYSLLAVFSKLLVTMNHQFVLMNYFVYLIDFKGIKLVGNTIRKDRKEIYDQLKILLGG